MAAIERLRGATQDDTYETERTCTTPRPRRRNGCEGNNRTQFVACHTTPVAAVLLARIVTLQKLQKSACKNDRNLAGLQG
jgi:hypothetical protein